jgi:hypothetical protein
MAPLYFIMAGTGVVLVVLRAFERGTVEPRMWWGLAAAAFLFLMGRRARQWRYPSYPEPR